MDPVSHRGQSVTQPGYGTNVRVQLPKLGKLLGHGNIVVAVESLVGVFDGFDVLGAVASSGHGNGVDRPHFSGVAFDNHVRRDILGNAGQPADEGTRADRRKVMHPRAAADTYAVLDPNVAGKHHLIGDGNVIRDLTVMGNMRCDHDEIFAANPRHTVSVAGASVDGDMLADKVAVANDTVDRLASEFPILGVCAQHGKRVDLVVLAESCE